ncbi:tetratricopeptide repeat protein [Owenweeksia hongkongensis]|uniref:tetratricopeptide repeat protein n=1 Tax=Owenweeksia hongkongensis TaxID=253245 RepID=UPI003A8EC2DC
MSPVTPATSVAATDETTVVSEEETSENQGDPDAMVDEALRQLQSGEVPPMQGILKIREVAEKYPGNVKANFTLGMLSMQTGQYAKAVGRFETVIEQQPENADAWYLLTKSQLNIGDTINAKQSFEKTLTLVDEETGNEYKKELPELE